MKLLCTDTQRSSNFISKTNGKPLKNIIRIPFRKITETAITERIRKEQQRTGGSLGKILQLS